ncbi:Oidioi.mRNA.OKI2018_I69.XSR.g14464.t3.cds [Oikopleura dioica]|uniref:Oidioi.mRNA.OKI2018_I69.XSR.g14464.t3.cds n=1 Tax=Oikopleura dioica TaxID=34765 RepID=A0ABN7SDV3_OIKDI|nr:Oidioi.mRNA.OKI2018_I69.XSR.g14464.t3.cds [Oikopleura dioica]
MEIVSSDDQEFQIQEACSTSHLTFKAPSARNPLIRQRSGTFAGFTEIEGNRTAGTPAKQEIKEEELQEKEKIKKLLNERRKFSRQNKWGNCSYKDLIVAAIESSPSKKMTLNEIYEWIVKNIQYFKNDSDTNSSVAWKNSVRHNLSLHPIFQKEPPQTGGSRSIGSYWKIDRSKDRAKGRGRAKTLPMQDLQSARVRRTDKPPTGRKSKSKVTKTGQQRRDSTPYNDSSIKKSSHTAMVDDNPMNELNSEFFKMGHPSTVATSSVRPPIAVPDDGDEQVTIQVRVPYEAFRLYREGNYNICILPKNHRELRQYSKAVSMGYSPV